MSPPALLWLLGRQGQWLPPQALRVPRSCSIPQARGETLALAGCLAFLELQPLTGGSWAGSALSQSRPCKRQMPQRGPLGNSPAAVLTFPRSTLVLSNSHHSWCPHVFCVLHVAQRRDPGHTQSSPHAATPPEDSAPPLGVAPPGQLSTWTVMALPLALRPRCWLVPKGPSSLSSGPGLVPPVPGELIWKQMLGSVGCRVVSGLTPMRRRGDRGRMKLGAARQPPPCPRAALGWAGGQCGLARGAEEQQLGAPADRATYRRVSFPERPGDSGSQRSCLEPGTQHHRAPPQPPRDLSASL